jgi:hypothetical protein
VHTDGGAVATLAAVAALAAIGATAATPPFVGKIAPLPAKQRALMTGVSWRPGCPVAHGRAIDVNPIENPYVENGRVYHDASRLYITRRPVRTGMAVEDGALVRAFDAIGWGWGGRWSGSVKDYQHFSAGGR